MFQHPWLLAGMLAAAAPILIHMFGQRHAPKIPFAAFDFLMAVHARLARRENVRKWLLLLLRTLAMLLLPLALARPMLVPPTASVAAAQGARRLCVVVDTSGSMGYVVNGAHLLSRAQEQARTALSYLSAEEGVMVISAGAKPHVWSDGVSTDHAQARAVIDGLKVAPLETADMGAAIDTAVTQCANNDPNATVLVLSDLANNSFQHVQPLTVRTLPKIMLQDVAERGQDPLLPLPNVAIESVTVAPSPGGWEEKQINVTLHNFGAEPVAQREITLRYGEGKAASVQSGYVDIPARQVVVKSFTHRFDGAGVVPGAVQLATTPTDGFAADDQAQFVASIARGVQVLAINGDPRTLAYDDELYFVERALGSIPKGDAPLQLRQVSTDEADGALLDVTHQNTDVIVLANVSVLSPASVESLHNFVRAGGGVLFAMGDRINFEDTNKAFADLLPFALRDMHRAEDAVAGTPALGFGEMDWQHPVLRDLGSAFETSLRSARTSLYYNLDVGADKHVRTLMRFDNGAPALIEARASTSASPSLSPSKPSRGRVMWLAMSLDRSMGDLPLRSAFPALLQRMMRYLGGTLPTPGAEDPLAKPFLNESDTTPVKADALMKTLQPGAPGKDGDNGGLLQLISTATMGGDSDAQHGDATDPQRGWAFYLLGGLVLLFVAESLLASRG